MKRRADDDADGDVDMDADESGPAASGVDVAADVLLGQLLLSAAAAGDMSALSSALDAGADVTTREPASGMSALMKAADGGHAAAVAALLQAGCPWNMQDNDGYTAGEGG
eukprot:362754-Chlamydomonas_euryale.AAC.2